MDLSNHVIVPLEDFHELQATAYNQPTPTASERVGSSLQTIVFCAAAAAAVTGASWGWATAVDWIEEKRFKRARQMDRKDQTTTS